MDTLGMASVMDKEMYYFIIKKHKFQQEWTN